MLVSELAASLEEARDELQVVKRKNTALIKVSVCFGSSVVMRLEFIIDTCVLIYSSITTVSITLILFFFQFENR